MRAILPGRPHSKRQALCTAYWDGLRLVAYVSGNTVIVLSSPREIVQSLRLDHARSLTAVTIEESSGRIAVCDERRVILYNAVGRDEDDLRWVHAEEIEVEAQGTIHCLSWGSVNEILVGGSKLWLYHVPLSERARLIWSTELSSPAVTAVFSNDAELIASYAQHDRLVKIWRRLSSELDSTRFDTSYLPHPAAVTNLHWRKPWHAEQNLDALLYTFCADHQVRLWTYSDPHSLSMMQLIATVDTMSSIQPRRLSVGSISRRRYSFIFDSRDFSHATEKALQRARPGRTDHALEHLVEVANRSPELCIVLDGLGHMSAWGIENAGCKTTKATTVFNVALVDDARVRLSFDQDKDQDYIQLCTFATNSFSPSISLLVHSYTGQIDWYDSPIAEFFDTSTREDRLSLASSWSGHELPIDHIARSIDDNKIMSWSDAGEGIVWSQTLPGALQRVCEVTIEKKILAVLLFGDSCRAVSLHTNHLVLWDISKSRASQMYEVGLESHSLPDKLSVIQAPIRNSMHYTILVTFTDRTVETWQLWQPSRRSSHRHTNGSIEPLTKVGQGKHSTEGLDFVTSDRLNVSSRQQYPQQQHLFAALGTGDLSYFSPDNLTTNGFSSPSRKFKTAASSCSLTRATTTGHMACVHKDGVSLSIWTAAQSSCELHHRFEATDQIRKLLWTSTRNGHLLLFVGLNYHAVVIGQQRYSMQASDNAWEILQNIRLRDFTTSYLGDASWLANGDLAIGAGNQIFVLDCVCNKLLGRLLPSQTARKEILYPRATEFVDGCAATLPIYSARYIEYLLLSGRYGVANEIWHLLYQKLKFFVEGDEIDTFLETDPLQWLRDQRQSRGVSAKSQLGSLEEIEDSFQEYIARTKLWHLSAKETSDISKCFTTSILLERHRKSLDENAQRYLHQFYNTPNDEALPWSAFVFALRSDSQEALLDLITSRYNNKITWPIARRTGIFVWLRDQAILRTQFENVAKAEYNKHEDRNPVDCSLYYLALNQKNILRNLWRVTVGVREKENTMKLLSNNFDDPKWKATALKNAYALLGKRRFEYGAAFFLLGDSLKDAINVCVNQLVDVQLAIAICRVQNQDFTQSQKALNEMIIHYVLPMALSHEQGRWVAAWAFTMMQQPASALQALVRPLDSVIDASHPPSSSVSGISEGSFFRVNDPQLSLLYPQLRNDLLRKGAWTTRVLEQREEQDFLLRTIDWYNKAGLCLAALQLAKEWKFIAHQSGLADAKGHDRDGVAGLNHGGEARKNTSPGANGPDELVTKKKPPPTQFVEPSADSLLDSFGF